MEHVSWLLRTTNTFKTSDFLAFFCDKLLSLLFNNNWSLIFCLSNIDKSTNPFRITWLGDAHHSQLMWIFISKIQTYPWETYSWCHRCPQHSQTLKNISSCLRMWLWNLLKGVDEAAVDSPHPHTDTHRRYCLPHGTWLEETWYCESCHWLT